MNADQKTRADHAQALAASATKDLANAEWLADEEEGREVRSILIFDGGSRGWRIGEAVIDLAREYGYDPGVCDCVNCAGIDEPSQGECEHYSDTTDESTSYLNDLLREGGSPAYFTQDGDFFLQEARDVSCSLECLDCSQPEKFCVCSEERERDEMIAPLVSEIQDIEQEPGRIFGGSKAYVFDFAGYYVYVRGDNLAEALACLNDTRYGAKVYNASWTEHRPLDVLTDESPYEVIELGPGDVLEFKEERIAKLRKEIERLEDVD